MLVMFGEKMRSVPYSRVGMGNMRMLVRHEQVFGITRHAAGIQRKPTMKVTQPPMRIDCLPPVRRRTFFNTTVIPHR